MGKHVKRMCLFAIVGLAHGCAAEIGEEPLPLAGPLDDGVEIGAVDGIETPGEVLYEIEVAEDHTVGFVDSGLGAVIAYEKRPTEKPSALLNIANGTAAGIFEALRPGEPIPATLAELDQSPFITAEQNTAAQPASVPILGEPDFAAEEFIPKHATEIPGHFRYYHKLCPTALESKWVGETPTPVWGVCWTNRQGPGSTGVNGSTHAAGYIGPYHLGATMNVLINGSVVFGTFVLEGQTVGVAVKSNRFTDGSRSKLEMVDIRFQFLPQGYFHFGGAWTNNPELYRHWLWGKGAYTGQ